MAIYMWRDVQIPDYLCFTANTASSTVKLNKTWSPTVVTLETSTDGINWSSYTIGSSITLVNVWDKLYFRNTSETTTGFSTSTSNYYRFLLSWSLNASWDITSLINKNFTDTLVWNYAFYYLFSNPSSNTTLKTAPKLPATNLTSYCYRELFLYCAWLTTIPELPATVLQTRNYREMFLNCSNIKISTTQTWEYQTPYRMPTTWTWTTWTGSFQDMFLNTWWTFTWTPSINTTYYTSNTLV